MTKGILLCLVIEVSRPKVTAGLRVPFVLNAWAVVTGDRDGRNKRI